MNTSNSMQSVPVKLGSNNIAPNIRDIYIELAAVFTPQLSPNDSDVEIHFFLNRSISNIYHVLNIDQFKKKEKHAVRTVNCEPGDSNTNVKYSEIYYDKPYIHHSINNNSVMRLALRFPVSDKYFQTGTLKDNSRLNIDVVCKTENGCGERCLRVCGSASFFLDTIVETYSRLKTSNIETTLDTQVVCTSNVDEESESNYLLPSSQVDNKKGYFQILFKKDYAGTPTTVITLPNDIKIAEYNSTSNSHSKDRKHSKHNKGGVIRRWQELQQSSMELQRSVQDKFSSMEATNDSFNYDYFPRYTARTGNLPCYGYCLQDLAPGTMNVGFLERCFVSAVRSDIESPEFVLDNSNNSAVQDEKHMEKIFSSPTSTILLFQRMAALYIRYLWYAPDVDDANKPSRPYSPSMLMIIESYDDPTIRIDGVDCEDGAYFVLKFYFELLKADLSKAEKPNSVRIKYMAKLQAVIKDYMCAMTLASVKSASDDADTCSSKKGSCSSVKYSQLHMFACLIHKDTLKHWLRFDATRHKDIAGVLDKLGQQSQTTYNKNDSTPSVVPCETTSFSRFIWDKDEYERLNTFYYPMKEDCSSSLAKALDNSNLKLSTIHHPRDRKDSFYVAVHSLYTNWFYELYGVRRFCFATCYEFSARPCRNENPRAQRMYKEYTSGRLNDAFKNYASGSDSGLFLGVMSRHFFTGNKRVAMMSVGNVPSDDDMLFINEVLDNQHPSSFLLDPLAQAENGDHSNIELERLISVWDSQRTSIESVLKKYNARSMQNIELLRQKLVTESVPSATTTTSNNDNNSIYPDIMATENLFTADFYVRDRDYTEKGFDNFISEIHDHVLTAKFTYVRHTFTKDVAGYQIFVTMHKEWPEVKGKLMYFKKIRDSAEVKKLQILKNATVEEVVDVRAY